MTFVELHEAQLYRLLAGFFGRERVIPHMSVLSVCGGELPSAAVDSAGRLRDWARSNKCLFTIIDADDIPKMVIEFFSGFDAGIDPTEAEHQQHLPHLLGAAGVRYVTMTMGEFEEILNPKSSLDLFSFLESKVIVP